MRSYGLVVVLSLLLSQLVLLPTRSFMNSRSRNECLGRQLATATNANTSSDCSFGRELNWTERGGWFDHGAGQIKDRDLEGHLSKLARRSEERGYEASIRARIPADASASHLVYLTKCMERAGIENLRVAVIHPKAGWY